MTGPIEAVADLVHSRGADRDRCRAIASYVADRAAALSLASLHSSSHSALGRDAYLVQHLGLTARQIRAWVSLLRGTRSVTRGGRSFGGRRGMVAALAAGDLTAREQRRFTRLAHIAATGRLPSPTHHADGRGQANGHHQGNPHDPLVINGGNLADRARP